MPALALLGDVVGNAFQLAGRWRSSPEKIHGGYWGLDDGHDTEPPFGFGLVEERPDMVELAVVPARPVRVLQLQHRDVVLVGGGLHLAVTEAVADLLEQRGRRDCVAEMLGEEANELTTDGHVRDVGVQIEC